MDLIDIPAWVISTGDNEKRVLREAIHVILAAISRSEQLHDEMFLKGGVLLAIKYKSSRYTVDIDCSTQKLYSSFDQSKFIAELEQNLALASVSLPYNVECRIQGYSVAPKGPEKQFHNLTIRIGYAKKGTRAHRRLLRNQAPEIITIDYSFNEVNDPPETVKTPDGGVLNLYQLHDLIAEKYRAMLQQVVRNRVRRQDAYDLYCLFQRIPEENLPDKKIILKQLIAKSESRGLTVDKDSILDKEVIERSKREYPQLGGEIEEKLPDFDAMYKKVADFYQSLPWDSLKK